MSIPINQDTSTQPTLTFTTVSTPEILNIWQKSSTNVFYTDIGNVGIGTTTNINFKLKVNGTVNATAFNGDGANITSVPYSTITGKPTNFQSDWTSTIINKPTNFQSDWNSTVINKPSTFPADMTNIYTKTETNNLLSAKEATLTFTSPLTRTTNTISFSESAITTLTNFYNKTDADARYLQLSGGTLTGNLNVNANITTQQLYINNQNSTASIIFSPNPSIYSIFSRKVPWAMYFAEDFNPSSPTVLPNYISNSRDATLAGTIAKTTEAGNGATGNITYISGGTGATISFPAGSIPSTFTILSLTRYNGETKRRIIQSSSGNWLHGHWAGNRGVAYYEGWKTSIASTGTQDNWLCFIGKNVGATTGNILVDGAGLGTATGGTGGGTYTLSVNISSSYDESSHWALSCVMIWDTALTDAEMQDLNTIINTYKNDGVSIKSLISTTIDDDSIIESRVYSGLEKTELLLFKGNDGTGTNGADRIRLKAGSIAFDTYSSLTPSSSRNNENIVMLINENGNVGIGTTTNLTSKLNINGSLNATSLSGDGANITSVPYSTITGKPTNFQSDWTTTIINKPTTFPADMTNIYTKTETNNLLSAKEATLTFTSPLTRTTNTISFTESAITTLTNFYNKNDADNRYLKLSGGSLTGNVYGNDILLSVNKGSFKRIDTLSTANVNVPGVGEEGPLTGGEKILLGPGTPTTHPYSIGLNTNVQWYSVPTGATQIFYVGGTAITTISSTGLTTTGVINATTNLQENGTNLTSKYLRLSGGTMIGDLNITDPSGVNSSTFTRMLNIVGTQARLACWSSSTSATSGIELISAPTNGSTVPTTFTSRWDLNCGNSTTGDFLFIRQRTTGTTNTYFVIGSTGSVGIGTTVNTSYKLNVDGALNSTSLYNNGTLINFSSYATNTDLTTNYYNKTDSDARYLKLTGGTLTGNLTLNTDNTFITFGSREQNYLIKLWGDLYGFGINSGMLRYNSDGNHSFFCGGTQRARISSTGLSITGEISSSSYLYGNQLRIDGNDQPNSLYNGARDMGLTVDNGKKITIGTWTGSATNYVMECNSTTVNVYKELVASVQVRSPFITATQNSRAYTSGIYGTAFNGWYIDLNTFWSGNAGNGGTAYLTLSFCFSQNTSIKWFGRVMVNSAGGAFYIITDLKTPTSGLTMIDITNEWGTSGQNFLYISQAVMNNTYTLIYKIIG